MKKSKAQLEADIRDTLRKRALLEEAIEYVYHKRWNDGLTLPEACEAVREMLSGSSWGLKDVSDKALSAKIEAQIPDWF